MSELNKINNLFDEIYEEIEKIVTNHYKDEYWNIESELLNYEDDIDTLKTRLYFLLNN
jgi:hypothetical protein